MAQNNVNVNMGTPMVPYARYSTPQMGGYAMTGSQWGYMMAQPMPPVEEGQVIILVLLQFERLILFINLL